MFQLMPVIDKYDQLIVDLILKYKTQLSEYVLLHEENIVSIDMLLSHGLKVIPVISHNTVTSKRLLPSNGDGHMSKNTFYISEEYQKYIDFIINNIDLFDYILIGDEGPECCGYIVGASFQTKPMKALQFYAEEMNTLITLYEQLQNKVILGPMDFVFERDAMIYKDNLDASPVFSILQQIPFSINYCGFWCLYDTYEEFLQLGYSNAPCIYSTLQDRHKYKVDPPCPPYEYYKTYLNAGANIWSGVGHHCGATKHHLKRLIEYGYQGCIFIPPRDEQTFVDYLIDTI